MTPALIGGKIATVNGLVLDVEMVAECYRLKAYTDGDLAASSCSDCRNGFSSWPVWDGSFPNKDSCLRWNSGLTGGIRIDGKDFRKISTLLYWDSDNCRWALDIMCTGTASNSYVWRGYKDSGCKPEGTYTRSEGCDTTSSLEIEACP
jgi:hypothetical protein